VPSDVALTLRLATMKDADLLWAWRNDPEVVAQTFSGAEVGREEHIDWLARTLDDPGARIYVVEAAREPFGQVRLTTDEHETVEVHISLAESARGSGVGRKVLRLAAERAASDLGASVVVAKIMPSNERSLRAFLGAGFHERQRSSEAVVLERRTLD